MHKNLVANFYEINKFFHISKYLILKSYCNAYEFNKRKKHFLIYFQALQF